MSKVGRAAFNSSRMRVEKIASGATKVITSADAGELYLLDGADNIVITLPTAQDGAYFKFVVHANAIAGGKSVVIKSAAANVLIDGSVLQLVDNADGTADLTIFVFLGFLTSWLIVAIISSISRRNSISRAS